MAVKCRLTSFSTRPASWLPQECSHHQARPVLLTMTSTFASTSSSSSSSLAPSASALCEVVDESCVMSADSIAASAASVADPPPFLVLSNMLIGARLALVRGRMRAEAYTHTRARTRTHANTGCEGHGEWSYTISNSGRTRSYVQWCSSFHRKIDY